MTATQTAKRASVFSIVSNVFLAAIKWTAGYFGNSYALIADAIESTTDIFSSLAVWAGIKIASKPADHNHPYGHGRVEPLITFIVVGFLIISATLIAVESINNIRSPQAAPEAFTLIVLLSIILWKEASYRIVVQKAKKTQSTSLKADAWHHRSDSITSIAAAIGILIALVMGEGYETADDWAALFAALVIFYNSYKIFKPALSEIMDENIYEDIIQKINTKALETAGILSSEKCMVRKTGMTYYVDIHISVDSSISVKEGHEIAHSLKNVIRAEIPEVADVLIHVEPEKTNGINNKD